MLLFQVNLLSLAVATTAVGTILSLSSSPALADSFDFSYSGAGITASGTLTTNPFDPTTFDPNTGQITGGYLITGITGQRNGTSISGLADPGTIGGNDNLLIAASDHYLDHFGFGYQVVGGAEYYNVFNVPGGYFEQSSLTSTGTPTPLTSFSITPPPTPPATSVPEPSQGMVVVGVGAWIGSVWGLRKKKLVSSQQS